MQGLGVGVRETWVQVPLDATMPADTAELPISSLTSLGTFFQFSSS